MKLLSLCATVVCVSAVAQDTPQTLVKVVSAATPAGYRTGAQAYLIKASIKRQQPFQLPGSQFGPSVTVTAADVKEPNDGVVLQLVGVELKGLDMIVQADGLNYHWDSGEIELVGKVHIKPTPKN